MNDNTLRREATALRGPLGSHLTIESIVAAFQAQRLKEVRALQAYLADEVNQARDLRIQTVARWLDQRANELQDVRPEESRGA